MSDKREEVKALYPKSSKWRRRVNRMSDEQVYAIWVKAQNTKKEGDKK